jgi:hypothetical protein
MTLLIAGFLSTLVAGVTLRVTSANPVPVAADSLPSCSKDLELLQRKIQQNYAGYTLEVRGERLTRFSTMKAAAEKRAAEARGSDCFFVLRDFLDWFADPHLFVFQSTEIDTAETVRRARAVERRAVTESEARAYYAWRRNNLDPIEGIWYDRGLRVAIVPDSTRTGSFVAVVLTPDTTIWTTGSVRAHISRRANGGYDVDLAARNYATSHLSAQIYRRVLLRLSPGIWGKEFPVAAADSGTLDPVDPHRPTFFMRGATPVFALPSHNPSYKKRLDSLVLANRELLSHADRMIIDLRGNEGGSSFMSEYLEPFLSTKEEKPNPFPDDHAVMLSSDNQIAYAKFGFGSETTAFVRTLLARLRAAPGQFVPLNDPSAPPKPADPREWVVTSGPRAVGVLTDGGTVSAGEVLVERALRSNRATVFGAPTAGALDYQSVSLVSISPSETRWFLGYPTIARSPELPSGGMRGRGIQPQVPLDVDHLPDPIAAVDGRLASKR